MHRPTHYNYNINAVYDVTVVLMMSFSKPVSGKVDQVQHAYMFVITFKYLLICKKCTWNILIEIFIIADIKISYS